MNQEVFEAPDDSSYRGLYAHSVSATQRVPVDGDKMVSWAKTSPVANKLMATALSLVTQHHGWSADFVERVREGQPELVAWLSKRPFLIEMWWEPGRGVCVCVPAIWDSWQLELGVEASPSSVFVRQVRRLDACLEQLRGELALDMRRQLQIGSSWESGAKTQNPDRDSDGHTTNQERDAQGSM